jgi:hypothetical protein
VVVVSQRVGDADDLPPLRGFGTLGHQHEDVMVHLQDEAMVLGQGRSL